MSIDGILDIFKDYPKTKPYPVIFVGHGSPMNGIEENVFSLGWKNLGQTLPKPRAIMMISAHWLAQQTGVDVSEHPQTIHDFSGFPQELYELKYPAPGAPQIAHAVKTLLAGRDPGEEEYGLDHGAWIVLRRMYPQADIPVFQLAIHFLQPGVYHYEIGKALAPLRDYGVLIVGSGNIVHNLKEIDWRSQAKAFDWAEDFDHRVKTLITEGKHDALCNYASIGSSFVHAVPTPDHYYPLLYVLGAGGREAQVRFPIEGIVHGSISMRSVVLG